MKITFLQLLALAILSCSGVFWLSACNSSNSTSVLENLHPAIQKSYDDSSCKEPVFCGDIVMIDCGQEVDGPLSYYDNTNGEALMYCGGACMMRDNEEQNPKICTACPPEEWKCR